MRLWLFHPLVFYPIVLLLAAGMIGFSLMPQLWPRPAAPVAAQVENGVVLLERAAFNSPEDPPQQDITVTRNLLGQPQALRIAVLPEQGDPTPQETGVRLLLEPEAGALLSDRGVRVEVQYQPLAVNAASALAVSLQGSGETRWVSQPIPPLSNSVTFTLPATQGVTAIGLRAISGNPPPVSYGVEITSIRASARARN